MYFLPACICLELKPSGMVGSWVSWAGHAPLHPGTQMLRDKASDPGLPSREGQLAIPTKGT